MPASSLNKQQKFYGKIIVIKRNGQDSASFDLSDSNYLFGRAERCDIRIQLATIGEEHCRIFPEPLNRFALVQNLSSVGLNLNGAIIKDHKEHALKHGDIITIVERSFRFENPFWNELSMTPLNATTPVKKSNTPVKADGSPKMSPLKSFSESPIKPINTFTVSGSPMKVESTIQNSPTKSPKLSNGTPKKTSQPQTPSKARDHMSVTPIKLGTPTCNEPSAEFSIIEHDHSMNSPKSPAKFHVTPSKTPQLSVSTPISQTKDIGIILPPTDKTPTATNNSPLRGSSGYKALMESRTVESDPQSPVRGIIDHEISASPRLSPRIKLIAEAPLNSSPCNRDIAMSLSVCDKVNNITDLSMVMSEEQEDLQSNECAMSECDRNTMDITDQLMEAVEEVQMAQETLVEPIEIAPQTAIFGNEDVEMAQMPIEEELMDQYISDGAIEVGNTNVDSANFCIEESFEAAKQPAVFTEPSDVAVQTNIIDELSNVVEQPLSLEHAANTIEQPSTTEEIAANAASDEIAEQSNNNNDHIGTFEQVQDISEIDAPEEIETVEEEHVNKPVAEPEVRTQESVEPLAVTEVHTQEDLGSETQEKDTDGNAKELEAPLTPRRSARLQKSNMSTPSKLSENVPQHSAAGKKSLRKSTRTPKAPLSITKKVQSAATIKTGQNELLGDNSPSIQAIRRNTTRPKIADAENLEEDKENSANAKEHHAVRGKRGSTTEHTTASEPDLPIRKSARITRAK